MEKESASFWAGIKKYEDILSRDPQAYSFAPLADIYRKLGLLEEAIAIARRGVALHPDFASGQMSLAVACLENNMVDEARKALEVVVRVTPENLDAQRKLAGVYASAGNAAAAERCLQIIADLDPDASREVSAYPRLSEAGAVAVMAVPADEAPIQTFAEIEEEDLLEADILELTDDLIEEEIFTEEPFTPFAAAPERPSLQAAATKDFGKVTPVPVEPALAAIEPFLADESEMAQAEDAPQPAVMTATIAELFISQGMIDKGVGVYRELLRENPDNDGYRARLQALTTSSGAGADIVEISAETTGFSGVAESVSEPITSKQDPLGVLEGWLSNIGRIRECRTESR